jgi:hypothetical protein
MVAPGEYCDALMNGPRDQPNRSARRGPGRPPTSECHAVRDSIWAYGLRAQAALSFAELERRYLASRLDGVPLPERLTGAFAQYARGVRGPTPPGRAWSQVTWAEAAFPGSSARYKSVLWDLLGTVEPERWRRRRPLSPATFWERCQPEVRALLESEPDSEGDPCFPIVTSEGLCLLTQSSHLDAFALLVYQVYGNNDRWQIDENIFAAQRWLRRWAPLLPGTPDALRRMLRMLEIYVPSLASGSGLNQLELEATDCWEALAVDDERRRARAERSAYFGAFIATICEEDW